MPKPRKSTAIRDAKIHPAIAEARRVLEVESAAILGLIDHLDNTFVDVVELINAIGRPRHHDGPRQVGHHLQEGQRDAGIDRHAFIFPASRRGHSRRPRHDRSGRYRPRDLQLRRDRGVAAAAAEHQADRRGDRGHHRQPELVAGEGRGLSSLRRDLERSVSARPRADGVDHRHARPRRRAGDGAADAQRIQGRGLRLPPSRRKTRQTLPPRLRSHALRRRRFRSCR